MQILQSAPEEVLEGKLLDPGGQLSVEEALLEAEFPHGNCCLLRVGSGRGKSLRGVA